jgi:hypothetical protein
MISADFNPLARLDAKTSPESFDRLFPSLSDRQKEAVIPMALRKENMILLQHILANYSEELVQKRNDIHANYTIAALDAGDQKSCIDAFKLLKDAGVNINSVDARKLTALEVCSMTFLSTIGIPLHRNVSRQDFYKGLVQGLLNEGALIPCYPFLHVSQDRFAPQFKNLLFLATPLITTPWENKLRSIRQGCLIFLAGYRKKENSDSTIKVLNSDVVKLICQYAIQSTNRDVINEVNRELMEPKPDR